MTISGEVKEAKDSMMRNVKSMPVSDESRASSQTARATLALREMLVQGQLMPGEKIREVPLAAQLNVSRIPLHLALQRLAHEGFLEIRPKRGFVVQQFSTDDIYDSIELRGLLEGSAARMIAERYTDARELAQLAELSRQIVVLVRRSKLTIEGFNRYIDLNARFHEILVATSGSRMLRRAIAHACSLPFASPSAFLKRQSISPELRELFLISADQHCGIVDAIRNHEGQRAEALTREHARVARRNLEDALKNQDIPLDLAGARLIGL
jgi:GntR family transcriptional regulator of vanillate catabolism